MIPGLLLVARFNHATCTAAPALHFPGHFDYSTHP